MKKNLIFPLVVSSLFIPSIEAIEKTTDLNSLENENNIYEAVDILIATGGKMSMEEKRKKKERQKKAQEIRNRQKVINEKGYVGGLLQGPRETILKIKTKINNDPLPRIISKGDFFKLLDEKYAKLKFLDITLNVIDELQVVKSTPTAMRDEKWMKFYEETYKPFLDLRDQMPEGLNTHEMRSAIWTLFADAALVAGSASQDYVDEIDKNLDGIPDS